MAEQILEGVNPTRMELLEIRKKIVLAELQPDLPEDQIRVQISEVREQISEKEKKKAVIEQKIKDIDELLEKGKCSLCGQEIHEEERFKGELEEAKEKVDSFSNEISILSEDLEKLEVNLKDLQKFTSNKSKIELSSLLHLGPPGRLQTNKKTPINPSPQFPQNLFRFLSFFTGFNFGNFLSKVPFRDSWIRQNMPRAGALR